MPDDSAYSDYVVVATVQGLIEEAQVCSFLQGNGIPTRVRGCAACCPAQRSSALDLARARIFTTKILPGNY